MKGFKMTCRSFISKAQTIAKHPAGLAMIWAWLAISPWLVSSSAYAADSVRAWGASSNTTMQMQSSASYHLAAGQVAQVAGTGSDSRPVYRSVTTCGVCTYNTNTGNNNSIHDNGITSTNSGSVNSATSFTDTTLVTTNSATTGSTLAK